jgi:hypothetical protein
MQSQHPIIILGGPCRAGRAIAALLLEHTTVAVVLAGRRHLACCVRCASEMRVRPRNSFCNTDGNFVL